MMAASVVLAVVAAWLSGKVTRGSGFELLGDLFLGLVGGMIGGWIFSQTGISAYGFVEMRVSCRLACNSRPQWSTNTAS